MYKGLKMKKEKKLKDHVRSMKIQHNNQLCQPVSSSGIYPRYLNIEEAHNGFVLNGSNGRVITTSLPDLLKAVKEYFSKQD